MTQAFAATKPDRTQGSERAARPLACALQRSPSRPVATCVRVMPQWVFSVWILISGVRASAAGVSAAAAPAAAPAALAGPLLWPLEGDARPLRGGFGEPRSNHFHAGLDLSTGGHTGARVLAPAASTLERVRTSGVGFGRALYLKSADGRLIVFGHLDAFEPVLAAWVDSTQRASGEYDQDLYPPAGRFRYAAGEQVAWSGESGAGPPHLHVEVRHGDFALSPLLAGLAVPDTIAPVIRKLVLEPLDEHSYVARGAAPWTLVLPAQPAAAESLAVLVEGRVRLTLVADDAAPGSRGLPVRIAGARWNGEWVECRMDSVSWAGEMAQTIWLLDSGRVTGSDGVILDAPAGIRPRFLASSRPDSLAIELVRVIDGSAPRALELYAVDAAGNSSVRRVWLRGPQWHELGPDTTRVGRVAAASPRKRPRMPVAAASREPEPRWNFACLPDQRLRISVTGTPNGLRDVRIERGGVQAESMGGQPATWDGKRWTSVLFLNGTPDPDGLWIKGKTPDGKAWWHRGVYALWPGASPMVTKLEDWAWFVIDPSLAYEASVVLVRPLVITGIEGGGKGIRAAMDAQPADLPLLKPVWVSLKLPAGMPGDHTGLCRRDGDNDGWEWTNSVRDSLTQTFRTETWRLGQFALVRDDNPPEVTLLPARTRVPAADYPQWAYSVRLIDRTSGIAGSATVLRVDGQRVPTEWDSEKHVLRWRPLQPPAPGLHQVRVDAVDRAGNHTVRTGSFVIASH